MKGKLRRWLGIEESDKRIRSCEDHIRRLEQRIGEQEEKLKKTMEFAEMLGGEFSAYLIDKVRREML